MSYRRIDATAIQAPEHSPLFPAMRRIALMFSLCEVIDALPKRPAAKTFIDLFNTVELDTLDSDARAEKPRFAGDTARARLRDKIKAAIAAQKAAAA